MASPFPFFTGDVLTAADMNSIGDRLNWTPTIGFDSGSTTTIIYLAEYAICNNMVIWQAVVGWNSAGTASGAMSITLPVAPSTSFLFVGAGREGATTGKTFAVFTDAAASTAFCRYYDNSAVAPVSVAAMRMSGSYLTS